MSGLIKLAIFGAVVALIIYGAFSVKVWACRQKHPTASAIACLF